MKKNSFSWGFIFFAGILTLANIIGSAYFMKGSKPWMDFSGQWSLCAYTLNGVDPYPYIAKTIVPEAVKDFGLIPYGWNTTPWGLTLGNIFYFGFLELKTAKIFFSVLSVISLLVTSYFVFKKAKKIFDDKKFLCLILIITLTSIDFFTAFGSGNAGGIICAMLLLAWVLCDDHPILTGILLGLVMVKPQTALIICFGFLLQKKFLPLIIGALIDIASWVWASVLTGSSIFKLLEEFVKECGVSSGGFTGIFWMFVNDYRLSTNLSMIAGIIFVMYFAYVYRNDDKNFFGLCFSYMASTFWSYHFGCDNFVLVFPAIICLYIAMNSMKIYQRVLWFAGFMYCSFGMYLKSKILYSLVLGYKPNDNILITFYEFGIIFIAFMMCKALNSNKAS